MESVTVIFCLLPEIIPNDIGSLRNHHELEEGRDDVFCPSHSHRSRQGHLKVVPDSAVFMLIPLPVAHCDNVSALDSLSSIHVLSPLPFTMEPFGSGQAKRGFDYRFIPRYVGSVRAVIFDWAGEPMSTCLYETVVEALRF